MRTYIATAGAAFVLGTFCADAGTFEGYVERIVDGDTIRIVGRADAIRLFGMDAPEMGEVCLTGTDCGRAARDHLRSIAPVGTVVGCTIVDRDVYGRDVATCSTSAVDDMSGWMVSAGWATDFEKYSGGRYAQHERDARVGQLGMWTSNSNEQGPVGFLENRVWDVLMGDLQP